MYASLKEDVQKNIQKYSHLFDKRLQTGLERLMVNAPDDFIPLRSHHHLKILLAVQFFMQKKMEEALESENADPDPVLVKLFQSGSRICCATCFPSSHSFNQEQLLAIFHTLLSGIQTVLNSSYMWFHPVLSYQFCYIEVEKMRGHGLSTRELRALEKAVRELLLALSPLTPTIFWPYNAEESFRQVQLLQREMQNPSELAHISILFQEQSLSSLEFLVHYAKPKGPYPLEEALKKLPQSFDFFFRFKKIVSQPFPIDIGAFSLKVPSSVFDVRGSINLLYARRYIAKYLEMVFGPFRDYNGGLFEKQQYHFELLRVNLSDKIPLFDLFAEKVFYALHPIEARLGLSLQDAEKLFLTFSEVLRTKETFAIARKEDVIVVKNGQHIDALSSFYREVDADTMTHAHLSLGTADYFCCSGQHAGAQIPALLTQKNSQKNIRTLRLCFQEGAPPSLNPHLSSGDMRCRLIGKLLFEGLIRLNSQGEPEPAGAIEYFASADGLHYTFKLRPCFWSNGEKVTAIDYVTSWQRALRDGVNHPEQLFVIKNGRLFKEFQCDGKKLGVHAEDSKTLEIELEYPDPYFLHKLAQPFFFPLFGSMREPKWFNGPYIVRGQSREGLLLERNPYFWKADRPYLEQIELKWLNNIDMNVIFRLFQEGKNDWVGDPLSALSPEHVKFLQQEDRLHFLKVNRRFLVHFNTKLFHLSHPNIRHALSLAIDRPKICETIFPLSTPLSHLALPRETPSDLFASGLEALGLTQENFPPLTFAYSHQTGREALALCLQKGWKQQLDVSVRLDKIEWNLFRNKLEKGEFEIVGTIQETLENAPLEFLERFEGSSSWNFSQWRHSGYRTFLNQARQASVSGKKLELQNKAEAILSAEAPFTPLFRYSHLFAHQAELQNYFFDQEGCVDFSQAYFVTAQEGYCD